MFPLLPARSSKPAISSVTFGLRCTYRIVISIVPDHGQRTVGGPVRRRWRGRRRGAWRPSASVSSPGVADGPSSIMWRDESFQRRLMNEPTAANTNAAQPAYSDPVACARWFADIQLRGGAVSVAAVHCHRWPGSIASRSIRR